MLSRRTGIPISLAILYTAVARRAGLETYGVATPGHFVVGCGQGSQRLYVHPFQEGEVLDPAACRERIETATGQHGQVSDEHFRPAAPLEIAVRVLRNLKTAYAMADQWKLLLPVQKRFTLLLPGSGDERRDLGLIYLRTGQAHPALEILEIYARQCGSEQPSLAPYLRSARRMMAEMN